MRCPRCGSSPIALISFLLIGWITISCRNCSCRLVLESPGNRFWIALALGGLAIALIWFYVEYPFRLLGETGTLVVFVAVATTTFILAMYFAWKDGRYVLTQGS